MRSKTIVGSVVAGCALVLLSMPEASFAKKGGTGKKKQESNQNQNPNAGAPVPAPAPSTQPSEAALAAADMKTQETAVRTAFEAGPDWTNAQANLKQAQSDYLNAEGPALATLKDDPKYQAALAQLATDQSAVKDAQSTGTSEEVTSAAMAVMKDHESIKELETAAMATDPSISSLKTKVASAQTAIATLRLKEQSAVEADPTYQDAKKRMLAARAQQDNPAMPGR